MPRLPPASDRIIALLCEFEELRVYNATLFELASQFIPIERLVDLPPAPALIEFEREKVRQHFTYQNNLKSRKRMRLKRLIEDNKGIDS